MGDFRSFGSTTFRVAAATLGDGPGTRMAAQPWLPGWARCWRAGGMRLERAHVNAVKRLHRGVGNVEPTSDASRANPSHVIDEASDFGGDLSPRGAAVHAHRA